MTKYPANIDDSTSLPSINNSEILGINFNLLRDAVLAIESELGSTPSGVYSTVKNRLDTVENQLNQLTVISLTTDLGGTINNPKVIGLQGRPITTQVPNFNDVIAWNGTAWTYKTVVDSGIAVVGAVQGSIVYYNGTNWVQLSPGTSGQYLRTNGVGANPQWNTVSGGGGSIFSDADFTLQDNTTPTKQLKFELSTIASGTTRTITVPNANITLDDVTGTRTPTDNTVSTIKVVDNNITLAKIQQITTDRLLGRDTAGTGNVEQISLDTTLVFTGSTSIGRAAISGDITIAAGSNTAAIASGVIVNADVNASAGINLSKLESITASTLVGNPTGAGAVPSLVTLDSTLNFNGTTLRRSAITGDVTIAAASNVASVTNLTIASQSQGDMLYYNGASWARVPGANRDGYILSLNSFIPTWIDAYNKNQQFFQRLGQTPDYMIWAEDFRTVDGYTNGTVINDWKSRIANNSAYFVAKNSPTVNTTGFNSKRAINITSNAWLDGYIPGVSRTDNYANTIWTTRDSFTFICAFTHSNTASQYLMSLGATANTKFVGLFIDHPTKRFIPVLNSATSITDSVKSQAPINTPIIVAFVKKDEGSVFSNTQYKLYVYIGNNKFSDIFQGPSPTLDILNNYALGAIVSPTGAAPLAIINNANIRFACHKFGYVATEEQIDSAVEFIKSSSGFDCPV